MEDELKALRRENIRLKQERDILKKATVSSMDHSNTYNNSLITMRCSKHEKDSNQFYTTGKSRVMGQMATG